MSYLDDVREFHERFGLTFRRAGNPGPITDEIRQLRKVMLLEEVGEYEEAVSVADQIDALLDLAYFALGTVELYGVDGDEAWRRIHAANLRKVRATVPGKRGSTFDVVKPPGWEPPDHRDLTGEASPADDGDEVERARSYVAAARRDLRRAWSLLDRVAPRSATPITDALDALAVVT